MPRDRRGIKNSMYGKHFSEESKEKMRRAKLGKYDGEKNPRWKGGRLIRHDGYVWIHSPNHPNVGQLGYMMEHRLVMEKHLGRYLTLDDEIHHKNGVKTDNRIENLLLTTKSQHTRLHWDDGMFDRNWEKRKN